MMEDEVLAKQLKELENAGEIKIQKAFKWIKKQTPSIVALFIAIWWIFYGTLEITEATYTLPEKIGLTICTIVMAVSYTGLIADTGFNVAKDTVVYKTALANWHEATKKGIAYQKDIMEYARSIAKNNIYMVRKGNLEANMIEYSDIFNEDGSIKKFDITKYKKHQRKIIKQCMRLKVNLPAIFGNVSSEFFGIKKEITQAEYQRSYTVRETIIRAVISFVSVGFMFNFIGFSVGSVIYAIFQIALWSGSGYMQRIKNYTFTIDTLIPQIESKTNIINGYMEGLKLKENKEVLTNGLQVRQDIS